MDKTKIQHGVKGGGGKGREKGRGVMKAATFISRMTAIRVWIT